MVKLILVWVALAGSFTLLLGSYIYIQNTILFRNPLGDESILSRQMSGTNLTQWEDNLVFNSTRLFSQSLDFTGMPPIFVDNLTKTKARILGTAFSTLGLDLESANALSLPQNPFKYSSIPPIQEDRAWYGILGVFLLLPVSAAQLIQGIRKREPFRVGLVFLAFSFSICVILIRPGWTPNQGRYFLIPVMLTAPFIACIVQRGRGWRILDWIITILAFVTMFNTTASNVGKPLLSYTSLQQWSRPALEELGQTNIERFDSLFKYNFPNEKSIFDMDRTGRQLIQSGMSVKPVNFVNQNIPEVASLALKIPASYSIFPFFGGQLTRKLFLISAQESFPDEKWFQSNQIGYLLIYENEKDSAILPRWMVRYKTSGDWTIFTPIWSKTTTQ